ncbi:MULTISPECIES: phytoene/squalene synthase family protein [Alicyclobacillus]|uniref:Phytoene synthase n=1 Tax=Alicyclobacillus vulcanalis TaxID=252246 RepID=A0A1N7JW49_9BACL|nr:MULTISPECIES: squalene/phytoene synthase family protein [Alicyclobacillus]SIS53585.1 phytoene synthase [Alicyclobacillus vulcanalis]
MNLTEAYEHCARRTREAGSSFYYGMRMLPPAKRRAMYAIYAWSRLCDDAVDDHTGADALSHLATAERIYRAAYADDYHASAEPVVLALGDAVRRFGIPQEPFAHLVRGMRLDMEPVRLRTLADLEAYCDDVAGTVGLMCVHIFGYRDGRALELAIDMGRALQLTNILRDLGEDLARDRVYLPEEEMERYGYSFADLVQRRVTPAFFALMRAQAERAKAYYARAAELFSLVEPDSLRCLSMLYIMYRRLLDKIEARGFRVFDERISLSGSQKLRLVWGVLWNRRAIGSSS